MKATRSPFRIGAETHETLKELAAREHLPVTQVVARLAADERRRVRRQELDESFARPKGASPRWASYQGASQELEGTLMDGLEDDEGVVWDESLTDAATW